MLKKIIIITKKLICFMLISLLILPTYATDKNKDPDAFITKKEVDKTISDFNSRLNAFETGINAKIDSQVSSYLDRNGIWSSAKQNTNEITFQYNELSDAFSSYVRDYIQTNSGKTEKIIAEKSIIEKVTKTGMIYMEVSWDKEWSVAIYCTNSSVPTFSHALFEGASKGLVSFGVINDSTGLYEEHNALSGFIRVVGGPQWDSGGGDLGAMIMSGNTSKITTMFYVNKGEKIICQPKLCWGGRQNNNAKFGNFDTNGGCSINGGNVSSTSTELIKLNFEANVY